MPGQIDIGAPSSCFSAQRIVEKTHGAVVPAVVATRLPAQIGEHSFTPMVPRGPKSWAVANSIELARKHLALARAPESFEITAPVASMSIEFFRHIALEQFEGRS